MDFLGESNRALVATMERLLLDSKRRVVSSEDVGTSGEVRCDDIRLAAKNINEVEKMLITLITQRGPLGPQLGWRFITVQRMHAEIKKEVKGWSSKLFGTAHLQLSSFGEIYSHIESLYCSSISGNKHCCSKFHI